MTAMGSPFSVVVAEIVMQHVEERALANCRQIDAFHDHLNEQNADISLPKKSKKMDQGSYSPTASV